MIEVHRFERLAFIEGKEISLSKSEHLLMIAFGMMGRKLISADLLMDVVFENLVRLPSDRAVLSQKIYRLKNKIGFDFVKCKPEMGYVLTERIEFTQ